MNDRLQRESAGECCFWLLLTALERSPPRDATSDEGLSHRAVTRPDQLGHFEQSVAGFVEFLRAIDTNLVERVAMRLDPMLLQMPIDGRAVEPVNLG